MNSEYGLTQQQSEELLEILPTNRLYDLAVCMVALPHIIREGVDPTSLRGRQIVSHAMEQIPHPESPAALEARLLRPENLSSYYRRVIETGRI